MKEIYAKFISPLTLQVTISDHPTFKVGSLMQEAQIYLAAKKGYKIIILPEKQ